MVQNRKKLCIVLTGHKDLIEAVCAKDFAEGALLIEPLTPQPPSAQEIGLISRSRFEVFTN